MGVVIGMLVAPLAGKMLIIFGRPVYAAVANPAPVSTTTNIAANSALPFIIKIIIPSTPRLFLNDVITAEQFMGYSRLTRHRSRFSP
jgi:hypothetical protein